MLVFRLYSTHAIAVKYVYMCGKCPALVCPSLLGGMEMGGTLVLV